MSKNLKRRSRLNKKNEFLKQILYLNNRRKYSVKKIRATLKLSYSRKSIPSKTVNYTTIVLFWANFFFKSMFRNWFLDIQKREKVIRWKIKDPCQIQ